MLPIYENTPDSLEIFLKKSSHIQPHLHKSLEFALVTEGTLEIGVGEELYHMETGDFAIVFPDLIHHYQVFDRGRCMAIYMLASPTLCPAYLTELQQSCPDNPVIPAARLHPDISYIIHSLCENKADATQKHILNQAFIQIILTRSMPCFHLVDKNSIGSHDIIYQTVSYISQNFREHFTLSDMAHDLGVSVSSLSRVFSGTFHRNFNQYLNENRLDYVCTLLQYTGQSITDACENAGFDSQRTFNRVFRERYHMSPRQYRQSLKTGKLSDAMQ